MIEFAKAQEISLTCVAGLCPGFRERALEWVNLCWAEGLHAYIYEGYRSPARQGVLFSQGRTSPGPMVTQAQPGQSMHQYGVAVDWVPLRPARKAVGLFEAAWDDVDGYTRGHVLAKDYNLRSLSWELPHLEDGTFKDWREAKAKLDSMGSDYYAWR